MTVYRDDSEVSELNRTAHLAPVRVERRLFGSARIGRGHQPRNRRRV